MTSPSKRFTLGVVTLFIIALFVPRNLPAAETAKPAETSKTKEAPTAPSGDAPAGPEEADIKKIREKYWTRGNEAEIGVVQNRIFTKRRKLELGLEFDSIYGDPFLSTAALTLTAGYYFDEARSVYLLFAKDFVSPSSALNTLETQLGTTANTNNPYFFLAAEAHWSLLYGKVSLLGLSILHFDAFVSGGLGMVSTESGNNFLVLLGIGQLLHINRVIGLSLGYKLLWYRETILGKVSGVNGNLGQNLGTRSNLSSMMAVGISFLLDPMPEEKPKSATP